MDRPPSSLTILERGVHVPERGFFRLKGAADDPVSIGGDVLLTRTDRQRHKIPVYSLTTGQPLPDVTGEGAVTVNLDNSAFHSLFPDAELAIVRIPKPSDRASPGEIAEHQARMRELVEQSNRYHQPCIKVRVSCHDRPPNISHYPPPAFPVYHQPKQPEIER